MDDWKPSLPEGILPDEITISDHERILDRRFHGAYEVKAIEQRQVERCGCESIEARRLG